MVALSQKNPDVATPAEHMWRRAFRDVTQEHGFVPLRIEGALPADLKGTLYRVGPSMFGVGADRYQHWFDGDGAVSAVRFDAGRATGALKLVQSKGLVQERAAGRRIHAGYGTRTAGPFWKRVFRLGKNAANTSIIGWQGKVYALFEGGRPTEVSPEDLSTLGERDLGVLGSAFSAHPHRVPARKATYNIGVRFGPKPGIDVFELPDEGPARKIGGVSTATGMVHDFIATSKHLVFFFSPLRLRPLPMLLGNAAYSECLDWKPEVGTEIVVMPLDAPEKLTRFTVEPFFQWHFANAFEDGGELVVDYVRLPDFATNRWLGDAPTRVPESRWTGRLHRARIQLAEKRLTTEERWSGSCEFPRVGSKVVGEAHRFVFAAAHSDAEAERGMFDELAKIDVARGEAQRLSLGRGQYPSEPVFVRRPGAAAEDDGHLLTLVYDGLSATSHVAVLDAQNLERGPLARVHFGHPVPFTFHGNFVR